MDPLQKFEKTSSFWAATISLVLIVVVIIITIFFNTDEAPEWPALPEAKRPEGVCPPFHLLDERGDIINPVAGYNANKPYSPAKTCGKCHDYRKITEGYHFTQGSGESPPPDQAARCQWVTTPGNFGGNWCSPAPLYRYLSPKTNRNAATMDMTSFSFITAGCGDCHPGGGPTEFDRTGKRYDQWMADPASGMASGGDNNYDGDYYQAQWIETGVLEADCFLCHLPEYDNSARKAQIKKLNFRWAPTAGAGFANVVGSVGDGQAPTVQYLKGRFNPDGTVSPHIVRQPRNEACLACHAKPGWKKRGANLRARTDVHLRAGLKCVDCHPAGRSAEDVRIRGKEIHQFGKGDDPGGHVRDDLDSSGRDCAFCHSTGKRGAPVARHSWLPPLHLDTIACQTCHIPERAVKAALVQAGDVLNPGAKIPTKGKHLWVFYGPDMRSWNHYGELEMMGYDDKPTDPYQPVLARYQGKIYPVNRVHSSWPAIKTEGEEGLMQPRMGDIYKMWIAHQKDSAAYPRLADIRDDNGDEVPEINRPEEIEALIASVTKMLADIRYPMEGKKVVWVMNDRIYSSGADFEPVLKHSWEASPYGNVHKYNHDVYPAKAALGVNGCIDCHNLSSAVFFADILKYPFSEEGEPVTVPQYEILEISGLSAGIGALRETYGKPILYGLLVALLLSFAVLVGELIIAKTSPKECRLNLSLGLWFVGVAVGVTIIAVGSTASLADYVLPSRFWLDANHFLFSLFIILMGITALSWEIIRSAKRELREGLVLLQPRIIILVVGLSAGIASGLLMLLKLPGLEMMTRASYTTFDASLMLILIGCVFLLLREALKWTIEGEK